MNRSATTFVKVIPAAGMASVYSPHVSRSRGHYPIVRTKEDHQRIAMRRAQFALEATIRAHRCDTFATLTFRDLPAGASGIRETWKKVLRRSQPSTGDLFYVMVAESDSVTRPNLHVLAGHELIERLAPNWSNLGFVDIKSVAFNDLGKISEYIAKDFGKPSRLFSRRYTALRGSKPKSECSQVSSYGEGIEVIASASSCSPILTEEQMLSPFGRFLKVHWHPCS